MPFRRRKLIMDRSHPDFARQVAFTSGGKLYRHLKRDHPLSNMAELKSRDREAFARELDAFREARRKGEREPTRMFVGMTPAELDADPNEIMDKPFTERKKRELHEVLYQFARHHIPTPVEVARTMKEFKKMWERATTLNRLGSFAIIGVNPERGPGGTDYFTPVEKRSLRQMWKPVFETATWEMSHQSLEFKGIPHTQAQLIQAIHSVENRIRNPKMDLNEIIPLIERKIVSGNRAERAKVISTRANRNAFVKKIHQEIGEYFLEKKERQKLYDDVYEYVLRGYGEKASLEYARSQGFKRARFRLKTVLDELGYQGDGILTRWGLYTYDPRSVEQLKRVWK